MIQAYQQTMMRTELERLRDENAELRKDAERYRWLRKQCDTTTNLVQYHTGNWKQTIPCNSSGEMDAAIDRAITQHLKGKA